MTAEAIKTAVYDPDADPVLDTRPSIRIRLRRKGVKRKPTYTPDELLHDATYHPVERTGDLRSNVEALEAKLQDVPEEDEAAAIGILAEMVELLLEDAMGLGDIICTAWPLGAVSVEYLTRTIAWIQREQEGRREAGEASRQS